MADWDKWHSEYLLLAQYVSKWSKDPNVKVGCVIVDPKDQRKISLGYNGFPKNISDQEEILLDKERKLNYMIHAEVNALNNTLFDPSGCYLYCTRFPCDKCSLHIVMKCISLVVSPCPDFGHSRWGKSNELSYQILNEAGVKVQLSTALN